MTANERGALSNPGEGLSRQDAAKTRRGDAARPIIPRQGSGDEQLALLPIAAPDAPLPAGTFDGADLALEAADAWEADGLGRCLEHLAATRVTFTADDARPWFGELPAPLWGAAFSAAARRGVIRPVAAAPSARKERRGGLRRIWEATPEFRGSFTQQDAS